MAVWLMAVGAVPVPLAAQEGPRADSLAIAEDPALEAFFTRRDAWLAAGFAVATAAIAPLDASLAGALQDSALQAHGILGTLADGARFLGFPGTVIIGTSLYAVGRLADLPRAAALGLHGTEAVLLSFAFVAGGKGFAGRARPDLDTDDPFDFGFARGFDGDDYQSFPSGHTAAAFAAAAAVTAESREIWPEATPYLGTALYTGALLVGVSRMYHNRHWASDVVAGAAIGTFSGLKVVKYHYRRPDNAIDRWLLPTALVPTSAGSMLVWEFPSPWGARGRTSLPVAAPARRP